MFRGHLISLLRNKSTLTFSQHTGAIGDRTDHAVQVVAVERRLDQGLVSVLVRALGHLLNLKAVILVTVVRYF